MKTFKNVLYLGIGTTAKMAAGLFALVIIARVLGSSGFGTLMILLSAAGVLCIVASLGINTYLLREAGRAPELASQTISDAFAAKLILVALTVIFATFLGACLPRFAEPAFGLLLFALLAESFTEFFNVGLRATGKYSVETKQSLLAALVYSAVVTVTAIVWKTLFAVAVGYLLSRLFISGVAYLSLRRLVGTIHVVSFRIGFQRLRATVTYSIDAALSALFGQVDGLVLGTALSPAAVGVYQGGLRIYMSATTGAGILTNVFLPKAAAEMGQRAQVTPTNTQVVVVFSAFGNLIGWTFAAVFPAFVTTLYGPAFSQLSILMPWFGALFALRLVAGGWGLVLTAAGDQQYRTVSSVGHWLAIALLASWLVPAEGAKGWLISLLAGTVILTTAYMWRAVKLTERPIAMIGVSCVPIILIMYACQSARG